MKDKDFEKKKQSQTDDFTWDDGYEQEETPEASETEDLFEEPRRERLQLIYPDEPVSKKEVPVTEHKRNTKKARRSYKKGLLWALVLLCAVIIAGFIFSDTFREMMKYRTSYTLWEAGDKMDLAAENTRVSGVLDGLILSGGADGISAYDQDQNMVWNVSYKMTNPVLEINGQYAMIVDVGGKHAVVCNNQGQVYTAQTQKTILTGSINAEGWITLISEEALEHDIIVFSKDGAQVLKRVTNGSIDGQPMTAVLSDDCKKLVSAYVAYNSSKLSGRVIFFDLSVSGGTYTDRISANFVYEDTIITDLYLDGDSCAAIGDNLMLGYDISGIPAEKWKKELTNQIGAAAFSDGFYTVIYAEELSHTQETLKNQLVMYNLQGEVLYQKALENPSYLQTFGSHVVYGEGRSYVCVDVKGRSEWFYNALEDVQAFYPVKDGETVLKVSGSSVQLMNIVSAETQEDEE
ncbi:MAG: hypothetical protein IJ315_08625 [Firmicutes bacterium]|nr:hypothetical protein [Bacillota bacterium]